MGCGTRPVQVEGAHELEPMNCLSLSRRRAPLVKFTGELQDRLGLANECSANVSHKGIRTARNMSDLSIAGT
jgi:hypothetical protein